MNTTTTTSNTNNTTPTTNTLTGNNSAPTRNGLLRTRWAAVGAAVAVSLGAGGIGLVQAAIDSGVRPVLVDIDPCRLMDSRADSQVGPRGTPLGEGEQYDIAAHGANGNCNIPAEAVALSLNVTGLNASAPTFLTVFPTDAPLPVTSNLNLLPGQAPAPNSVTTGLDGAGMFSVYNAFGTTNVVIDVNGYYEDHNHDDRYVQKTQMMWAVVDGDGELERSSDGVVSSELQALLPTGDYVVVFEQDISNCAYQATAGRPGVNVNPAAGFAQVANWQGDPTHGVIVFTKDQNGVGVENRGFHLLVTC